MRRKAAMLETKDHVDWQGIRSPVVLLLGLWVGFFLVVHPFEHVTLQILFRDLFSLVEWK